MVDKIKPPWGSKTAEAFRLPRGAYGLQIEGFGANEHLLDLGARRWPIVQARIDPAGTPPCLEAADEHAVVTPLLDSAWVHCQRDERTATLLGLSPAADGRLGHAFLKAVGAIFGRWDGRDSFHGGAFLTGGGAVALLGDNHAGKSTLLAYLGLQGHAVLTDDLLVVEAGTAFAGPHCIDLRTAALTPLGLNEADERLEPVAGYYRQRLTLGQPPHEAPLVAWVYVGWGSAVRLERVDPSSRLRQLAANLTITMTPAVPATLLELAELPGWELRRPRRWSQLPGVADRLLGLSV